MFECAIFGSGIRISAEERKSVDHVFEPLKVESVWGNDVLSWEKELLAHQTNGARLVNAIVLLQKWNGMYVEEAKEVLRSKVIEEGRRYQ